MPILNDKGSPRATTLVVAASNASLLSRLQADYVCDGVADNVEIQAAIDALPSSGGKVALSEGTFFLNASILLKTGVYLEGTGVATKLQVMVGNIAGITLPAGADYAGVRHLAIELNGLGLKGVYLEATGGNPNIRNPLLYDLLIVDTSVGGVPSSIGVDIEGMVEGQLDFIRVSGVQTGYKIRGEQNVSCNSHIGHLRFILTKHDNAIGLDLGTIEFLTILTVEGSFSVAKAGAIGMLLDKVHNITVVRHDIENFVIGLRLQGAGGFESNYNHFLSGYLGTGHAAATYGIHCTADTYDNSFRNLLVSGTGFGGSFGVRNLGPLVNNPNRFYGIRSVGWAINISPSVATIIHDSPDGFRNVNSGTATIGGGTATNGTGTMTGSPVTLVPGANTPTITAAGTFVINLPAGNAGTAATGGWTVTGSPVALVAGNNTITVEAGGAGTITITTATVAVTVTHALAATPTRATITPTSDPGAANAFWASAKGATTFVINAKVAVTAATTFDWHAQVGEG